MQQKNNNADATAARAAAYRVADAAK